jgi:hypothetical protein
MDTVGLLEDNELEPRNRHDLRSDASAFVKPNTMSSQVSHDLHLHPS